MSAPGTDAIVVGARMARLFDDGWKIGTVTELHKDDGEGFAIRFDSGQTKTMLPRAVLLLHTIDSNDTLQALLRSSGRELAPAQVKSGYNWDGPPPRATPQANPTSNSYACGSVSDSPSIRAKQIRSFNKRVYEARVAKNFRKEQIMRGMDRVACHERSRNQRLQHSALVEANRFTADRMPTPSARRRADTAESERLFAWGEKMLSPRFLDLEDAELLSPRLLQSSFTSSAEASPRWGEACFRPFPNSPCLTVSTEDIKRAVVLPPISSMMNPRNQMTSPIPQELPVSLRPPSSRPRPPKAPEPLSPFTLAQLLPKLSNFFYDKELADADTVLAVAQTGLVPEWKISASGERQVAIMPLTSCVLASLRYKYGDKMTADVRLQQLKDSCALGHGPGATHPRAEVFRRMAHWGDEEAMRPAQELTCTQLLKWLSLTKPPDNSAKAEKAPEVNMSLEQARTLLGHLFRLHLLPAEACEYYERTAEALRAEQGMIDADTLVLRWMVEWGAWDERDAIARSLASQGLLIAQEAAGLEEGVEVAISPMSVSGILRVRAWSRKMKKLG